MTSRAFWPDPLFGFFAKTPEQETRLLPIFLGALLRDCFHHGQVWGAVEHERVVGSASWLPPGATPRSTRREFRIYAACARALLTGRNRVTGMKLLSAVEAEHPSEPHWYLALLGVDPSLQGHGFGKALLQRNATQRSNLPTSRRRSPRICPSTSALVSECSKRSAFRGAHRCG